MKKITLTIAVIFTISFISCKKETKTTEKIENQNNLAIKTVNFGVRGNCTMCKKTIEAAANSVEGVATAIWNVDQKKITVSFDESKTNLITIHNKIAASGYDTEKVNANIEVYNELPACCQYDKEMKMNLSVEN